MTKALNIWRTKYRVTCLNNEIKHAVIDTNATPYIEIPSIIGNI